MQPVTRRQPTTTPAPGRALAYQAFKLVPLGHIYDPATETTSPVDLGTYILSLADLETFATLTWPPLWEDLKASFAGTEAATAATRNAVDHPPHDSDGGTGA